MIGPFRGCKALMDRVSMASRERRERVVTAAVSRNPYQERMEGLLDEGLFGTDALPRDRAEWVAAILRQNPYQAAAVVERTLAERFTHQLEIAKRVLLAAQGGGRLDVQSAGRAAEEFIAAAARELD